MITIPANTAFKPSVPVFTLQSTVATTLKISVDGITYTDYPGGTAEQFTGSQVFSDYPTGAFLQCTSEVKCSDDAAKIVPTTCTITVTAPAYGQIKVVDMRTKQPVTSVTAGDLIECIWFATTCNYRFVKWTIGGVDYFDERPIVAINANTTVAVELVELPR